MSIPLDFIVRQGLQVATNVVIGTYTLNVANPPSNGLIVSGNVGIGTSSPSQKLQVVGNIQLTNAAGTLSGIYFQDGTYQTTSATSYSTPAGGPVNSVQYNTGAGFGGSGNFVYTGGEVGIGTNAPATVLDVRSCSSMAVFGTRNAPGCMGSFAYDYTIGVGNIVPTAGYAVLGYSPSGSYAYLTTSSFTSHSLVVTQTNKIGIGTTAPISLLDIRGNVGIGTYAGVVTAPINGIAVSGNVGIGVNNTLAKLGIQADIGQTAIYAQSAVTAGNFLQFVNAAQTSVFAVNNIGNISAGGWQGNVIAANYGGTGQTSFSTGDILYAASSGGITTLSKLPIGNNGNILTVSSGLPVWGNVTVNNITGVVPIVSGGTNTTAFSGSAFVVTTANGLVMSSVASSSNAAVVFGNSGIPTSVTGGPYTYLTTGAGGGALGFGRVDLANGVTNTLPAGNGGTGQNTIGQYQMLVGGSTNNWNLLSSTMTSAMVTSVTGSPQWISGAAANTVLHSDGSTITFAKVNLTTDVTSILPYANGGTNANTSWTQGSVIFAGATAFAQNNSLFFWDNANNRLGIGTITPTTTLDVNGAATIRNGANIVAGGLYVQSGIGNFASSVIANSINSNSAIYTPILNVSSAANVAGLTSNTTVIVNGTNQSFNPSTGALTVAGGAGIGQDLNVGGNAAVNGSVVITGNLTVWGNVTSIESLEYIFAGPIIEIGAGNNEVAFNGPQDRGVEFHYVDNIGSNNTFGFFGMQKSSQSFLFVANASYPGGQGDADIFYGQPGNAYFGNITIGSAGINNLAFPLPSNNTTSGALIIGGSGGIGVGGNINAGGTGYFAQSINTGGTATVNYLISNTGINTTQLVASSSIIAANIISNSYINGTGINSSGPISAAGALTVASVVSNSYINGTGINSSGPISAAGALTVATVTSNGFIFGTSINTSGAAIFASVTSNTGIQAASVYSSGPVTVGGVVIGASVVSNSSISGNNIIASAGISAGNILVANIIATVSSTTGALIVKGGEAIGGNLFVAGSTWLNNVSIYSTNASYSPTTGALVVAGGVGISGNLTVFGNIIGTGFNVTTITGNSGVFYGDEYGFGAIYGGITTGYVIQPQTILQLTANTSTYAQENLQNINSGTNASGDYVITADNGNATVNFIDIGINSSTYSQPGSGLQLANDGYLYIQGNAAATFGGNLNIATTTVADIVFSTNGFDYANEIARFRNGQGLNIKLATVSTNTTSGALIVAGGVGIGSKLYVGGTITGQSLNATAVGNTTPSTGQFTTLQTINTALVNNLTSNGIVSTNTLYASSTINGAALGIFNNLTSNGYVQGAGIYSSGPISAVGTIIAANITSNGVVFTGSFNSSGTAIVNNITSNGYVQAASVYSSGTVNAVGTVIAATLSSNSSISGNSFILNGNLASIGTTGTVTVDSFATTAFRTVQYLAQITDNTNVGQFHSEQLLILQDGTTAYQTEFNLVYSAQPLGSFTSSISGSIFSLFFTPYTATNKSIRVVRTGVTL